jgi:hypothetical protein
MPDSPTTSPKILIEEIKGVNEREQFSNRDLGFLDILRNGVPVNKNTITKMNGVKLLNEDLLGNPILSIFQTNDSRRNIIVQTPTSLYITTEAELFGYAAPATNLTNYAINEEETMPYAVIAHIETAGTNGGTSSNTFTKRPLSDIVAQVNADGSAAAFVTVDSANDQFTLAFGKYRIKGWSAMAADATGRSLVTRLYNTTLALPAWSGLVNENGVTMDAEIVDFNYHLEFGGFLDVTTPGGEIFEVQNRTGTGYTNKGNGKNMANSVNEIYCWIEIVQTGT